MCVSVCVCVEADDQEQVAVKVMKSAAEYLTATGSGHHSQALATR